MVVVVLSEEMCKTWVSRSPNASDRERKNDERTNEPAQLASGKGNLLISMLIFRTTIIDYDQSTGVSRALTCFLVQDTQIDGFGHFDLFLRQRMDDRGDHVGGRLRGNGQLVLVDGDDRRWPNAVVRRRLVVRTANVTSLDRIVDGHHIVGIEFTVLIQLDIQDALFERVARKDLLQVTRVIHPFDGIRLPVDGDRN